MFFLEETWSSPLTLKNPRSRACPRSNGVSGTNTSQQSCLLEHCVVSPSQSGTWISFEERDQKQRSSGDDVIWESFLNDNTMLSYLVSVILVLYEILDTLSNSTLRWFNWASITINYQVLVSSISLQLYHICSQLCLILYSFLVRVEAFFAFLLYLISAFISCFSPNSATIQEQVTKLLSFL